jgi:hypothetical protein
MDKFTLDCRQLENWDFVSQLPVPLSNGYNGRRLNSTEAAALNSTVRFGKALDPGLGCLEDLFDIANKPVAATLRAPVSMHGVTARTLASGAAAAVAPYIPVLKFSSAHDLTGAFGGAVSSTIPVTVFVGASAGVYISTTREVGIYYTIGGGLTTSPGSSLGGELTLIVGTPADFMGPYLGISLGGNAGGASVTGTVLFTLDAASTPAVITLMGVTINVSGAAKVPVYVSIEVTNTGKLGSLKF